tara:strand:- start:509 stop:973 length:465 start_codon:yes stop_codon:yes gene_type:complete
MDKKSRSDLNFYTITSNFNEILLKLCKKIITTNMKVYVNFEKEETKSFVDRFLWIKEKNNFLPHKVDGEKITNRDKIILFCGSSKNKTFLSDFNSLIVSPCVSIRTFDLFKKYLIFSYTKDSLFNNKLSDKLIKKGFSLNWYDECSPFKWKKIL